MISKNIFTFLNALKNNNERQWFKENISTFRTAESEVKLFYSQLYDQLNQLDSIDNFKVFRIYRDIRFSKNKTPYKTHFGMAFHREKPALRGGYYIHIEPNNSFLGVGFWGPSPKDLYRIRKELEADADELREIINKPTFKKYWGILKGDELKTAPKGFNKTHANIDLIKKKQYTFYKEITDEELVSDDFSVLLEDHFKHIRPYFDYMSNLLTTNLNGESLLS